jgi:hypothetical protein
MARATRIYIVTPADSEEVLGAFTVKYESQAWAERHKLGLKGLRRYSVTDGGENWYYGTGYQALASKKVELPWT